mgnify:FL=1
MTTLRDILALLAVLACYGIAGRMDYDDALRQEESMRGSHLERRVCIHDVFPSAETSVTDRDELAAAVPDRDCEKTPL